MNIDDIKAEWKKDSVIDETKLGYSALETPKLHSKYLNFLLDCKRNQSIKNNDLNVVKKFKTRYYNGYLGKEELEEAGLSQYQHNKPLKSELEELLNSDTDVSKIRLELEEIEIAIYALESILSQIKSRDFQIKNNIQWNQYISGG